MSRFMCLSIVLGSLLAAPGCTSCFGGFNNPCRRPSFMEFRQPCGGGMFGRTAAPPMAAPCGAPACGAPACGAPACDPCGGSAAPCCEEGGTIMSSPASTPVVSEPGTFS